MSEALPIGVARPPALSEEIDELLRGAREYQLRAFSENTLRAYKENWREFKRFCHRYNFEALPASPRTVELYLKWCADMRHNEPPEENPEPIRLKNGKTRKRPKPKPREPLKLSAIEQRLAAIATVHELNDQPSPTASKTVTSTMDGIYDAYHKVRGREPKRAVVGDELRLIVGRLGDSLIDVRDRAILLLGFLGAFRRSELANLEFKNIAIEAEGIVCTLWRSKTNRRGRKGPQRKAIPAHPDPALCPVRALKAWMQAAGVSTGYVFRNLVHRTVGDRLSDRAIHKVMHGRILDGLCEWLAVNAKTDELVGTLRNKRGEWVRSRFTSTVIGKLVEDYQLPETLDPRSVGAHGLRSGMVTSAREAGKADYKIREITGHNSERMLDLYTHSQSLWKDNASRDLL